MGDDRPRRRLVVIVVIVVLVVVVLVVVVVVALVVAPVVVVLVAVVVDCTWHRGFTCFPLAHFGAPLARFVPPSPAASYAAYAPTLCAAAHPPPTHHPPATHPPPTHPCTHPPPTQQLTPIHQPPTQLPPTTHQPPNHHPPTPPQPHHPPHGVCRGMVAGGSRVGRGRGRMWDGDSHKQESLAWRRNQPRAVVSLQLSRTARGVCQRCGGWGGVGWVGGCMDGWWVGGRWVGGLTQCRRIHRIACAVARIGGTT